MIFNTIPATPDDDWKVRGEGEEEEAGSPSESYITTCCCLCLYYSGKMLIIYAWVDVKILLGDSAVLTQDLSFTNSLPHPSLSLSLFHLHFSGCNCLPDTKDAMIRSKRKFWRSCGVWENPIKEPTAGKWTSFPTTNLFKARMSWPMQQWTFTKPNNYFVTADIRCRPGVYAGKYVYLADTFVSISADHWRAEHTGVARIFVWGAPGRRHPDLHQSCTRFKLSCAARDLWALQLSAESWMEPQSEIKMTFGGGFLSILSALNTLVRYT